MRKIFAIALSLLMLSCLKTDNNFNVFKSSSGLPKEYKISDVLLKAPEYINTQSRIHIDFNIQNIKINRILITGEKVTDKLISFDVKEIKSLKYVSFYLPDASDGIINIIGMGKNKERIVNLRKKVDPKKIMVVSL